MALILEHEGMDHPSRWPGASSGITLGHGWDARFHTPADLRRDWAGLLDESERDALEVACGKDADWARANVSRFKLSP